MIRAMPDCAEFRRSGKWQFVVFPGCRGTQLPGRSPLPVNKGSLYNVVVQGAVCYRLEVGAPAVNSAYFAGWGMSN